MIILHVGCRLKITDSQFVSYLTQQTKVLICFKYSILHTENISVYGGIFKKK